MLNNMILDSNKALLFIPVPNALHTRNWVGVALCYCLSAASNTKTRRPSFRRGANCYSFTH